jgi:N-terminal domain of reverse transcriptase
MEQDSISTSWKDLPWEKFRRKSFHLQCRIYEAQQVCNYKLVKRFQKLLIKSKSTHYIVVKTVTESYATKGLFISDEKKLKLVDQLDSRVDNRNPSSNSWNKKENVGSTFSILKDEILKQLCTRIVLPISTNDFILRKMKKFVHPYWRSGQQLLGCISTERQRILKISIHKCLKYVDLPFLVRKLIIPQQYKVIIYDLFKTSLINSNVSVACYKENLFSLVRNIILEGVEDLNNFLRKSDYFGNHARLIGLRRGRDILYFCAEDKNERYFLHVLKNFLFVRGLTLESNSSFIRNSTDGFDFSKWHFETKLSIKFSLFPHFDTRSNYRKKLVYVLQNSHITQSLKIKMVTFMLHSWYKHNHFCSRTKLQLQCFYLKRLLDKYKYILSTFSKNHLINRDVN